MPKGTKQTIQIDVRGQNVSRAELNTIVDNIVRRTNNAVSKADITFLR